MLILGGKERLSLTGVREQAMWTGEASRNLGNPFFSSYKATGKSSRGGEPCFNDTAGGI
jgi:hypothetical protein